MSLIPFQEELSVLTAHFTISEAPLGHRHCYAALWQAGTWEGSWGCQRLHLSSHTTISLRPLVWNTKLWRCREGRAKGESKYPFKNVCWYFRVLSHHVIGQLYSSFCEMPLLVLSSRQLLSIFPKHHTVVYFQMSLCILFLLVNPCFSSMHEHRSFYFPLR